MTPYELTNDQRKYFGLIPVADGWDRHSLSDTVAVYFDENKLVKVLNYSWGYFMGKTVLTFIYVTKLYKIAYNIGIAKVG